MTCLFRALVLLPAGLCLQRCQDPGRLREGTWQTVFEGKNNKKS
jgi:hypothetical protein